MVALVAMTVLNMGGVLVAEAAQAVPKWTNRYTSLGAETKSLLADDSVSELRKLVPLRKNNGHVFGTFCSTSLGGQGEGNLTTTDEAAAAETGVVLFRGMQLDRRLLRGDGIWRVEWCGAGQLTPVVAERARVQRVQPVQGQGGVW